MCIQSSPRKNNSENCIEFDGFLFPLLQNLEYKLDGPEKDKPDRLFIRDRKGRFMFSFEKCFCIDSNFSPGKEFEFIEILHKYHKLMLWYPIQSELSHKKMGYFRLECPKIGEMRSCSGQLMITEPEDYLLGLRKIPEIFDTIVLIKKCEPSDLVSKGLLEEE